MKRVTVRKSAEISYLTFLGLSLTVVITSCYGKSSDYSVFSFSDTQECQTKLFDALTSAESVEVKHLNNSFAFDDYLLFDKVLQLASQLFVDIKHNVVTTSSFSHKLHVRTLYDFIGGLCKNVRFFELSSSTYKSLFIKRGFKSSYLSISYPVRAGPAIC